MRWAGNLMVVMGLMVGLAVSAVLYQWDTSQRASLATATPAATAPSATAPGAPATGLAPAAVSPTSSQKPGEGDGQAGKAVYNSFCNACHPNGKAGVGPAIIGLGEEAVKAAVRQGKGGMPAFKDSQISEAQLAELLGYIKTLK